jgi:hypothetical protein
VVIPSTVSEALDAMPGAKPDTLADEKRLFLVVTSSGVKP